ncbi:macro domain-containing protein [Actinokineospora diospyrosa]|uniref:O-acetyl-ADP-ribose deacetylase (Regulator of RNase III), contains Macro domain n=1 Tax=Actinokineospora diospyrosa TaxID=103728 RepID=A0ABT1ID49_9PSEU|nr:macro domain-containing protein [Actinokineospora diospyrosa]MCP2270513.1 O-acetyl-ADP-ribose deacetylase (regulator of RNase III), contains Macro domain [Actinokineospora diospyrosa]
MAAATRDRSGELELVLCAMGESLASAWETAAEGRPHIRVHRGSVLEVQADAVVSPANSYGWMRGGVDAVYAANFPAIEQRVRSAVLAYHGGELPVGEALIVPTDVARPTWLITAPTMKEPTEALAAETVHPYLAARAVFRLWRDGVLDNGSPVRNAVGTIAMPGLGTGVGGVPPQVCARQLAAAWDAVFEPGSVART